MRYCANTPPTLGHTYARADDFMPTDLYNEEDFDYFQYDSLMKEEELNRYRRERQEILQFKISF